jgi:anti-sigma factor RsiW
MNDTYTERLSEYLDGELDAAGRADVDAHLQTCAACRAVLDELRAVARAGRALGPLEPAQDLWPGIADRIAAERDVALPLRRLSRAPRRLSFTVPQLAAAAVALMFLSGAAVRMLSRAESAGVIAGTDDPGVRAVLASAGTGPAGSDSTIAQLERMLRDSEANLDPATVAVLQRNLIIIDEALAEARAALASDPANAYLSRHYENTMRKKFELLRQAGSIGRGST